MFSFVSADLTTDIKSYWKFDGDATDSFGSNDGTVTGATYTASGKINGAYDFDGTNDYITLGDKSSLEGFSNGITVSVWLKLNSYSSSNKGIISKFWDGSQRNYDLSIR